MPRAYSMDLRERVLAACDAGHASRVVARQYQVSRAWVDRLSAQYIAQAGAQLVFLPPYSPDLNPIEPVFAKLKALARGAAPRSREALWAYLGTALRHVSPLECQHYFHHCGYTVT